MLFSLTIIALASALPEHLGMHPQGHGAKATLDRAADDDPGATRDSYAELSDRDKDYFRRAPLGTLEDKLRRLREPLAHTVTVEVRLVGFDGDGAHAVRLGDRDFAPYLDALRSDVVARVLSDDPDPPAGRDGPPRPEDPRLDAPRNATADGVSRALPITTQFYFHVTRASPKLNAAVESAIRDAVASGLAPPADDSDDADTDASSPALVPHEVVDDVLAEDHRRSSSAYAVYLLNPNPPGDRPYAYSYRAARSDAGERGREGQPGCPGQLWVSSERRVWFDLTAGPSGYGPRRGGEGASLGVLPRVRAAHADRPSALVPPLVGTLRRACAHLFAPPMERAPTRRWDDTAVVVIRVTDAPGGNADAAPTLGLELAERALADALEPGQTVRVTETEVSVGTCATCAAAMHRALKTPGRVDPRAGSNRAGRSREYLDARELRYWMRAFRARVAAEIGVDLGAPGDGAVTVASASASASTSGRPRSSRVVPAFLFDLARDDPLLLDGEHAAMAFSDMIIAVRTRAPARVVDSRCDGRATLAEPADARRPMLAAMLRAAWGVAPTDRHWGDAQGRVVRDHLFSVGNDPFGHLSASFGATLPFHVSDAIKRHEIFASTAETTRDAAALLEAVGTFTDGERALGPDAHAEFVGRWASMEHKRERAMASAAMHEYARASHFAASARIDLLAAAKLVEDAAGTLDATMECFEDAPPSYAAAAKAAGGVALGVWAVAAVRGEISRWWNLRVSKQF